MIHFPSTLQNSAALPRRTDSLQLNATQQKSPSHQIFLTIEEELHDARRVHSHGQEEDLRLALNMLIERLSQLSTLLSDTYKTSADLEVQLNVAKSNLQLVISNNEMLEDALKQRDSSTAQSIGWRRTSARQSTDDSQHQGRSSGEYTPTIESPVVTPSAQDGNRFFKFRFTSSSPNPGASSSRPGTPQTAGLHHLNSPSLPVLPLQTQKEKEHLEELEKELEKEKKAKEKARQEKDALEAELESLSQALFEEANKMVATERIRRADLEEELKEARNEQQALRSALRLLEGENSHLRSASSSPQVSFHTPPSHTPAPSSPTPADDFESPLSSPTPASTSQSSLPQKSSSMTEAYSNPSQTPSRRSPSPSLLPSLSALPKRRTPPPPAPLGIPTTPFNYSTMSNGPDTAEIQEMDMRTPRRPAKPLDQDSEMHVIKEESDPSPTDSDTRASRDSTTTREEAKAVPSQSLSSSTVPGPTPEAPIPALENPEENPKGKGGTKNTHAYRPPSLHLYPDEHEEDPWAGATSASLPPQGSNRRRREEEEEGGVFGESV